MFRYAWPMVRIVICPCSCIGVHFLADLYFSACLRFADGRFYILDLLVTVSKSAPVPLSAVPFGFFKKI